MSGLFIQVLLHVYEKYSNFFIIYHTNLLISEANITDGYDTLFSSGLQEHYYEYYDIEPTPEEIFIKYLYIIVFPYFLLLGTVGNLISLILMRSYSRNVWSTCLYMAILLPMDTIKLYVECGNDWYNKIHEDIVNLSAEILLISNAVCKVYTFVYNLIIHESVWFMIAAAIEMTISMRTPLKIYKMCTRDRATSNILLISVLLISLNLHFFWTFGLTIPGDDPNIRIILCTYINELSNNFRDYIWPLIDFFIADLFPLLILTICVILTVPSIKNKGNKSEELNDLLQKYFLDTKALHELKLAMFVVIICNAFVLLCRVVEYGIMNVSNDVIDLEFQQIKLIKGIFRTIYYIYLSHKIFIFSLFCSKFRRDAKHLIKYCFRPFTGKYSCTRSRKCVLDSQQEAQTSWKDDNKDETLNQAGTFKQTT